MKVNHSEYIDDRLNREIKSAKKEKRKIKSFILTQSEYEELQTRPVFLGASYLPENISKYGGITIEIESNPKEGK
jgi:hypothetical protein